MSNRTVSFLLATSLVVTASAMGACSGSSGSGGFKEEKKVTKSRIEKNNIKIAAKDPEAPTSFEGSVGLTTKYDAASKMLTVTLGIKDGFHAYAEGEEIGMPVSMSVLGTNGWKLDGKAKVPAGTKKDLGELGTSVILEGSVPVTATVTGGKDYIEGAMKIQICTNKACDRPRTHTFKQKI